MPASRFRREVMRLAQARGADVEGLAKDLAHLMEKHNIPMHQTWRASRWKLTIAGIHERSLGDARLFSLMACRAWEQGLGLGLVRRGLLVGDTKALAWAQGGLVAG